MREHWTALARSFISRRTQRDSIARAIESVQEDADISAALRAFQQRDMDTLYRLAEPLCNRLSDEQRHEEALTVRLLLAACYADIVLLARHPEEDSRYTSSQLLERLEPWCAEAIRLSRDLNDPACLAHHLYVEATRQEQLGNIQASSDCYSAALQTYLPLADSQPELFTLPVLRTRLNLAATCAQLKKYASAAQELEALHKQLQTLPIEDPVLVSLQTNVLLLQGEVYRFQGKLDSALSSLRQALRLCPPSDSNRISVLNNLGLVCLEFFHQSVSFNTSPLGYPKLPLKCARRYFRHALKLWDRIPPDEQNRLPAQLPHLLSNMGAVHNALQNWSDAERNFRDALIQYDRINKSLFQMDTARIHNNLCVVLKNQNRHQQAREHGEQAIRIYDALGKPLESAEVHFNLGLMEEASGADDRAAEQMEMCVQKLEQGLHQLAEYQHRDHFKGELEGAALRLIERYAIELEKGVFADGRMERLIGLLEMLRHIETIPGFWSSDTATWEQFSMDRSAWFIPWDSLTQHEGAVFEGYSERPFAMLYIHRTRTCMVFVAVRSGQTVVATAPLALWEKLREISAALDSALQNIARKAESVSQGKMTLQELKDAVAQDSEPIRALGNTAYDLIPPKIGGLFTDETLKTVFLSPCRNSVNLPFELIRVKKHRRRACLGLLHLLPRAYGLAGLFRVWHRQPAGKKALIVINPTENLDPVGLLSDEIMPLLTQRGYSPTALQFQDATPENVLSAARSDELALWFQFGHGGSGYKIDAGEAEYLLMAGGSQIYPDDIVHMNWRGAILHFSCCYTGRIRGGSGGRFYGFPAAALQQGASCALSSTFMIFALDSIYNKQFYTDILNPHNPLPVGEALLSKRKRVARQWKDTPVFWCSTVLWGNPWTRLDG